MIQVFIALNVMCWSAYHSLKSSLCVQGKFMRGVPSSARPYPSSMLPDMELLLSMNDLGDNIRMAHNSHVHTISSCLKGNSIKYN